MVRLSYISEISSELLNNEFIFRDMFVPKPSRFSELFACLAPCYNYLDQELLRRSGSFSVNFLSKNACKKLLISYPKTRQKNRKYRRQFVRFIGCFVIVLFKLQFAFSIFVWQMFLRSKLDSFWIFTNRKERSNFSWKLENRWRGRRTRPSRVRVFGIRKVVASATPYRRGYTHAVWVPTYPHSVGPVSDFPTSKKRNQPPNGRFVTCVLEICTIRSDFFQAGLTCGYVT
jgi:hypothetical protein